MTVGLPQLVRLTAGKGIANTALRWIPFFLFELEAAFDASTETLTTILGVGEMAGLITLFVGRQLDAGRERLYLTAALVCVSVSAFASLSGSLAVFAGAFFVLIIGNALYTVAGHAYLSGRVPFARRSRYIGSFETSWATALLIGAPIISLLLTRSSWRAPFVMLGILAAAFAVIVGLDPDTPATQQTPTSAVSGERVALDRYAWTVIVASAAIAMAGLTTIVIAGTWLENDLGVSTGGVGALAFAFGAAELTSSASSAAFADRLGPLRTTRLALFAVVAGLGVMVMAGDSLTVAFVGLFMFFLGFEYAIVTSFAVVSEAMPEARGQALAASNAVGTFARGAGTVMTGFFYAAFGIAGPATISAVAAVTSIVLLTIAQRPRNSAATSTLRSTEPR